MTRLRYLIATSILVLFVSPAFANTYSTFDIANPSFIPFSGAIIVDETAELVQSMSVNFASPPSGPGLFTLSQQTPSGPPYSGSISIEGTNGLGDLFTIFLPDYIIFPISGGPTTSLFPFSATLTFNGTLYNIGGNLSPASATPLPSTWLMLLSGFVGLGYFAYRGTKKRTELAA